MKKTILFLCLSVAVFSAYTQENEIPQLASLKITPPTPEAAALIRFVEYPVSYCTGGPEITVPLYSVKSREISFPVTLNYHASGIKVEDVSGFVGLGWSLNAGGVISRVAHGGMDEYGVDMRDKDSVVATNDFRYLKRVANNIFITRVWTVIIIIFVIFPGRLLFSRTELLYKFRRRKTGSNGYQPLVLRTTYCPKILR